MTACMLPFALLLLQAPGDSGAFAQAPPREVKRLYWELFETTEVLVRLIPEGPDGSPPLVILTFQAFFPGRAERDPYSGLPRWPKGPPARLVLRAEGGPLTMIRELSLRLVVDGTTVELTGPTSRYRNVPCLFATDDCAPNGVEAELEPAILGSLIKARAVGGQALGFPIKLTQADQMALGDFVARIGLSGEDTTRK